ncbi:MAG: precorrin-6y C5,15-methyltransferase (decarboxylating) subunit CbiE [Desulfovibrionaceae bacterium]
MSIHVVGLGLDPDALPEPHMHAIDQAHILVGGKRQLALFDDHPAEKIVIDKHLEAVFAAMGERDNDDTEIVVLADGDPLFYGIGKRLIDAFGPEALYILPNVTTLQAAAAKIKIPWDGVATVSLHGRNDFQPLYAALTANDWVAVLTDRKNIPSAIAGALMEKGAERYVKMWVFEDMETEDERVERYALAEAAQKSFSHLNLVLLERRGGPEKTLCLGMACDDYAHHGVITKWPVRAAGLAALRLRPDNVVWDLGAGCGSVALEATALAHRGRVVAVEKNADRVADIRENIRRFGALSVDVVHGAMPGCLAELPDPDRIFIGGGLQKNNEVLREACRRLRPKGRLVIACVLFNSLMRTKEYLQTLDWPFAITLVQAGQSSTLASDLHLEGNNPVFILSAEKSV